MPAYGEVGMSAVRLYLTAPAECLRILGVDRSFEALVRVAEGDA